jgi:hypothetical protein
VFAQFDQINPPRSNCPAYAKVLVQKDTTDCRLDTFTVASITILEDSIRPEAENYRELGK